jgi:nucleotide-binding universal stress UspA family protein
MKILVSYNLRSRSSEKALKLTMLHACAFNASVDIVTSAERTTSDKELPQKEEAERALWQVAESFRQAGIACRTHLLIRGQSPGEAVVSYAKENEVDEIVVGVDRVSRVGKFVLGSLAQHIILKAPCPVLTVKASDEDSDVYLGSRSMYEA